MAAGFRQWGRGALVAWYAARLLLLVGLPCALVWRFGSQGAGFAVSAFAVALVARWVLKNPGTALAVGWVLGRR